MTREEYQAAGGGAFPISTDEFFDRGMTLRDWLAGQALAGILAAQADPNIERLVSSETAAKDAYGYADAMLVQRKMMTDKEADEEHFREWMSAVDRELVRRTGIDSGSLPDVDYRSMYDDEADPGEAAEHAIRNAKES